jgi:hypothetical protein
VAESVADESVEEAVEVVVEAVVAELEPVLARTASDPAPMMSFDSTSIMPPLSLLRRCPAPAAGVGRRCRRRRPVARPPRPLLPPLRRRAVHTDDHRSRRRRRPRTPGQPSPPWPTHHWQTVTRLPVTPQPAAQEIAEPSAPEAVVAPEPTPSKVSAPIATGEVADRLVELGVPRALSEQPSPTTSPHAAPTPR